jgi:hypothetical protein
MTISPPYCGVPSLSHQFPATAAVVVVVLPVGVVPGKEEILVVICVAILEVELIMPCFVVCAAALVVEPEHDDKTNDDTRNNSAQYFRIQYSYFQQSEFHRFV